MNIDEDAAVWTGIKEGTFVLFLVFRGVAIEQDWPSPTIRSMSVFVKFWASIGQNLVWIDQFEFVANEWTLCDDLLTVFCGILMVGVVVKDTLSDDTHDV